MMDILHSAMARIGGTKGSTHASTDATSSSIHVSSINAQCQTMSTAVSGVSHASSAGRMKQDDIEEFIGNDTKVSEHIESLTCNDNDCGKLSDDNDLRRKVKRCLVQERMDNFIKGVKGMSGGVVGFLLQMFISLRRGIVDFPISAATFATNVTMMIHDCTVCQYCFAASFNMLKPDGQYKSTWVEARRLFCKGHTTRELSVHITKRGATNELMIPNLKTVQPYTDSQERMLAWLYDYCTSGYGERSPIDGCFHMQYCTKLEICNTYNDRNRNVGEGTVMLRVFHEALKKLFKTHWCPSGSNIPFMCRFSKYSAFGKCTLCICIVLEIKATLNKGRRAYLLSLLQCHRYIAYQEKKAWYNIREQALRENYLWSLGADNLDKRKTRFINLGREMKGHGCDDLHTISATLGVVPVAGVGNFVFIASPLLADNSNLILETLHLTLMHTTKKRQEDGDVLAPELDVQVDGCRVNKNRTKWAWMAWLCLTGQMKKCSDNYMLVGHTHDLMDAILGVIARWIKTGLVITTMEDLKHAVENAFRSLYTMPVAVIFIHSVHHWTKFFEHYVAPVSKFSANIPDHERPHRFELWKDEATGHAVMHYKNLRQQDFYWNKEPIRLLPHGWQDFSLLEVESPSNSPQMVQHLRSLASSRGQFMRIYDVEIDSLQAEVGHSKQEWTGWWDMFAETVSVEKWNAQTNKMSKKTISRLKADLSAVDKWCGTNVHRIAMLPQVTDVPIAEAARKVTHVVPPVAPIFIPRNVKLKFYDQYNTDVEKKHLTAFVEGATDTECVRAARRQLKKMSEEVVNRVPRKAKPKKTPPNGASSGKQTNTGKKATNKKKETAMKAKTKAALSKEQSAIRRQMTRDLPGLVLSDDEENTPAPTVTGDVFKVKEACIGVQVQEHFSNRKLMYGLEWDATVLAEGENKFMWQDTSRGFENDEDFNDALNETWTSNRMDASEPERLHLQHTCCLSLHI